MTELHALPGYLAQLRHHDEGARLKVRAMQEVVGVLDHLGMSRRAFVREARRLGLPAPTVTSLGNWISCRHIPTTENVDRLIEALDGVLVEHGHNSGSWRVSLRESSHLHHHTLHQFHRDVLELEQAKELLEATIAWLDLAEFPPMPGIWPASFVPMTREHGIYCLSILREVHMDAAEKTTSPRAVEHELVVAKASIVLAHHLNITGQYTLALETADEGSYMLAEILRKYPAWRDLPVQAHLQTVGELITLAEYEVLGLSRKAIALHALGQMAKSAQERKKLQGLMDRTLLHSLERCHKLPSTSYLRADLWRVRANFALETTQNLPGLEQAEEYVECALTYLAQVASQRVRPLQRWVTLLSRIEALSRTGKLAAATDTMLEVESLKQELGRTDVLKPGPAHSLMQWRVHAVYWLAQAQSQPARSSQRREYAQRWRDAVHSGLQLAHDAALHDLERRMRLTIDRAEPEFRRLLTTG